MPDTCSHQRYVVTASSVSGVRIHKFWTTTMPTASPYLRGRVGRGHLGSGSNVRGAAPIIVKFASGDTRS